jgi:glutathione S-transferase
MDRPAVRGRFAPAKFIGDESQYEALKVTAHKRLRCLFEQADRQLAGRSWLAGFRSFAEPYFYMTLRWAAGLKIDLAGLDHIAAFKQRMEADPGVRAALTAEGLS